MKAIFRNIGDQITDQLKSTDSSVLVAVAWFTNETIFEILLDLVSKGKNVELIVNNDGINNRQDGLDFNKFIKHGGKFYFANNTRLMHHKFAIIDNSKIISGSYNWTYNAEFRNIENILTSSDLQIVEQFNKEFSFLKTNAYQQKGVIIPVAPTTLESSNKEYLKEDYLSKSIIEEKNGNIHKSQQAILHAQQLDPSSATIAERVVEMKSLIDKPKYHYHVEDGQFSVSFLGNDLIGKEGEIVKNPFTVGEIYILFINGFYVECIGNTERDFPSNKLEHEKLKKEIIHTYEWYERQYDEYALKMEQNNKL